MRVIMESGFDILYLIVIVVIGMIMIAGSKHNPPRKLFGSMVLVLGLGDAFHLVPRIYALLTDSMEKSTAALGFGTLVTSITVTVFYVMLYHFWCGRYHKPIHAVLTYVVYGLAFVRIILCLFPQNALLSADPPLSWAIYRNIPFVILGVLMIVLWYKEAKAAADRAFGFAWLAVLLSFLFYIPVVLFADTVSAVGMLMMPKTICYVWLAVMGYRACGKGREDNIARKTRA